MSYVFEAKKSKKAPSRSAPHKPDADAGNLTRRVRARGIKVLTLIRLRQLEIMLLYLLWHATHKSCRVARALQQLMYSYDYQSRDFLASTPHTSNT